MNDKIFEEAIAELHALIEDRAKLAQYLVDNAPKSYDIRGLDGSYNEGWRVGFRRCLTELKRIADKENNESN